MGDKFSSLLASCADVSYPRALRSDLRTEGPCKGCGIGCFPGYRHPYTGALTNVGNTGYSWSRTFSGTNGFYLSMGTDWVNPSYAHNRGHGFQVRCLQAFIGVPSGTGNTYSYGPGDLCRSGLRSRLQVGEQGKFSNPLIRRPAG